MYLFWSRKPNVGTGPTETEVLAAVRAVLEDAECQFASDIQKPDSFVRSRPAVDQVFRLDGIQVAMEHTRILAYEQELAQGHLWETRLEPDLTDMELQLSSELPAEFDYGLWIDVASRVRRKDWPRLLAYLVGWTRTTTYELIGFDGLKVRKHEIEIGKSFLWVRVGVYPRGFCSHRSHLRFHVERVSRFSEQAMRKLVHGELAITQPSAALPPAVRPSCRQAGGVLRS